MEAKQLEGKVALVTGSGRGMGRSIALALAASGAKVALSARTESELLAVQAEIESNGGVATSIPGDIGVESNSIDLVARTVAHFGRLDILVNNAGIGGGALGDHTHRRLGPCSGGKYACPIYPVS